MAYLVVLVLDDPDLRDGLLDAWERAGARGVTILESSGIGRVRRAALRDDTPLLPSLRNLLRGGAYRGAVHQRLKAGQFHAHALHLHRLSGVEALGVHVVLPVDGNQQIGKPG